MLLRKRPDADLAQHAKNTKCAIDKHAGNDAHLHAPRKEPASEPQHGYEREHEPEAQSLEERRELLSYHAFESATYGLIK